MVRNKEKIFSTVSYYLAFICLGMAGASLGPTLEALAENTNTMLGNIGILFTVKSIGYIIGSLILGRRYDSVKGHPIFGTAIAGIAGLFFIIPLVSHIAALALIMLAIGFFEGGIDIGGNTFILWLHGKENGPVMNGLHFCFGIGSFAAPLITAAALGMAGSMVYGYYALALFLVPSAVLPFLLPSPKSTGTMQKPKEGTKKNSDVLLALFIAVFFILYVGLETGIGGWIFTYAIRMEITGPTGAAILTSVFWGALTFGRLIGVPLSIKYSPRFLLFADLVITVFAGILLVVFPVSLILLSIATALIGLAIATIFPSMLTYAAKHINISGRINSIFFIGASLGGMSLPWAIGKALSFFGAQVFPVIICITAGLCFLYFLFTDQLVFHKKTVNTTG